jgi:hypothetical protein
MLFLSYKTLSLLGPRKGQEQGFHHATMVISQKLPIFRTAIARAIGSEMGYILFPIPIKSRTMQGWLAFWAAKGLF